MLLMASLRAGAVVAALLCSSDPEAVQQLIMRGLLLLPDLSPAGGYYTFLFFINPISSGFLYAFFSVHPVGKCHSLAMLIIRNTDY